jgi:hypothetical protein
MKNQIKFTELGKSYWSKSGAYQKEYDKLYEKFVPASGAAETLNGELIRAVSRLYWDYCNNGNGNACTIKEEIDEYTCCVCHGTGEVESEECEECGGSGVIEEEYESYEISSFFSEFLELIELNVPDIEEDVEKVRDMITNSFNTLNSDLFSPVSMNKYDILTDKVIQYVLNNEDKELPNHYNNK